MPVFAMTSDLLFLGSTWTLFPPHNLRGGLNLRAGVDVIVNSFLALILTQQGENHQHPDYGLAPELFAPTTSFDAEYLVWSIQTEIKKWIAGVDTFRVEIVDYDAIHNKMRVSATFVPKMSPDINILTFPYHQYRGAMLGQVEVTEFMTTITLNGSPFFSSLGK